MTVVFGTIHILIKYIQKLISIIKYENDNSTKT